MKLWFKAKQYGWGWYPATWQGWLVTLAAVAGYVWTFRNIDQASHSVSDTLIGMVVPFLIITGLLLLVCFVMGEKPRWRWGGKD
ncbi:hypothetical protein A2635_03620 [Candidatus Peribacteria bacterium RIFCSPHIGHO2_01_FULL_51_9]|nr:MAG: hypothetical protein A2635_03620 [Candidatus Peribacteria bacterium RIFCSPHIGHO2_01_FULL_51_9]HLC66304.1 hypothetical protein [Candidatus Nanoarchaeia archaeon]